MSRVFTSGIYRRGSRALRTSLQDIARELGWTHPAADLLGPWEGEETYEEVRERQAAAG